MAVINNALLQQVNTTSSHKNTDFKTPTLSAQVSWDFSVPLPGSSPSYFNTSDLTVSRPV